MGGLKEGAIVEIAHGLLDLFMRVHDDGAVPCDRLFDRGARDQEEADPLFARLHGDFFAGAKADQCAVA